MKTRMPISTTRQPPQVVWHYTTGDGLLGIINSGVLRAGSAAFMNDRNELLSGLRQVEAAFEERRSELAPSLQEAVAAKLSTESRSYRTETYVLSACQEGDNLTMWRNYGRSVGFSIGFDTSVKLGARELSDAAQHPSPPPNYYNGEWHEEITDDDGATHYVGWSPDDPQQLTEGWDAVVYKPEEQRQLAADVLEKTIQAIQEEKNGTAKGFFTGDARIWLAFESLRLIKDSGFQDEREWRMLSSVAPAWKFVEFRSGPFGLVPFVELGNIDPPARQSDGKEAVGKLPIVSVMVGPNPHGNETTTSVRMLLEKAGYGHIDVGMSDTPFR